MNTDQALALIAQMLQMTIFIAGPILGASLAAGVAVGVIQTATQVNEASVSYVVKVLAVVGVLAAFGPTMAEHATAYMRQSFDAMEHVVH